MCGICILISGKATTTVKQSDVFEQLLYATAVRGWHGTGVFTKDGWAKDAVLPREFTEENNLYASLSTKYLSTPTGKGNFMVGHCRAATRGEINAKNCHPFAHDHIMMVHNGTIREQSLLPEYKRFEVDSDNIAFSLATQGTEETIKNLNGAFALIWANTNENTLHLIKNSERPFFLQKTDSGAYYGASEEEMLKWILGRQNVSFKEAKGFELENGIEYVFDVDGTWKMEIERELHKPTYNSIYSGGRGGAASSEKKTQPVTTTGTGSATTTAGTTKPSDNVVTLPPAKGVATSTGMADKRKNAADERINDNLKQAGLPDLKVRDEIEFVMTDVSSGTNHDMYEGYALQCYEDVRLYMSDAAEEWDFGKVYTGAILSAYFEKKGLNDQEGDLVILINSQTISPVRDLSLQDELKYDAYLSGNLCSDFDVELLTATEEEEEEALDDDDEDGLLLDDLTWEHCTWCGASIPESNRAECELYVKASNVAHSVYCVDCIDSFEMNDELPF